MIIYQKRTHNHIHNEFSVRWVHSVQYNKRKIMENIEHFITQCVRLRVRFFDIYTYQIQTTQKSFAVNEFLDKTRAREWDIKGEWESEENSVWVSAIWKAMCVFCLLLNKIFIQFLRFCFVNERIACKCRQNRIFLGNICNYVV